MTGSRRVTELLLRWDELREQGRTISAEELCRDCPEHAAEVGRRILALQALYRVLGTAPSDADGLETPDPPTVLQRDKGLAKPEAAWAETLPTEAGQPAAAPPQAETIPGYEILGELGRGGMGVVYKARQKSLNRIVALKMILAGIHASPTATVRFLQEAETIARLKHPNIVHIHEFGKHDGKPYFSLEFVDGGSLAAKLRGHPLPPGQAAETVQTLARAVQVAHDQRIWHRDLKPGNILLTADGVPKIADFGLAKHGDVDMTATGEVLGTPSYMAPEQARGRGVGPAVDIYALGAILYELLSGRPPFRADTPVDTVRQVVAEEPVPPSRLNPKVPRVLEIVCLKCLEKEPGRRYASAEALAEDLRRFRAGEPIAARPAGPLERGWRWCRRNPVVASLSALLVLVLVAGLASVTHLWIRAETQRSRAVDAGQRAELLAEKARRQQALAEAQKTRAENQSKLARAEADKANKIAQVLTELFEASDPLGLHGIPLLRPKVGDTFTARQLLDQGAQRIVKLNDEPEVQAKLMDAIGNVYCTLGETEEARPLLERALALRRQVLPRDHPDLAATMHNLGWLHHQRGDYTLARQLYEDALAIRRKHAAAQPLAVGVTLFNLAWLLADMEELVKSEELFKEVLELRRKHLGDSHRDVAVARMGLAAVYLQERNFVAALAPYLRARATMLKVEGGKGLVESIGLFQRGLLADRLGSFMGAAFGLVGSQAENDLKRSLLLARKMLGDQHAYVALVLHELAQIQAQEGKLVEAEQSFRDCLRIARRYGLEHPKATILLRSFCSFLKDHGKKDEARRLLQEALQQRRKLRGPTHHLVADVLLLSAELATAPAERAKLLREAAAIYRGSPDASRRGRARCLNFLALTLPPSASAEAERLIREALAVVPRQLAPDQSFVALLQCNLAMFQMHQKKYSGLEAVLQQSLATFRKGGPDDRPNVAYAWRCLGRLYLGTGQTAKAADAALERRRLVGADHKALYEVACELGRCAAASAEGSPEREKYADLAVAVLRQAQANGFKNVESLRKDKALDAVRARPSFHMLVRELEDAASHERTSRQGVRGGQDRN
jgi:tetratricopeptide (TPR) repeat protein/tRNA A-37 threonylcarbamoyl transferase component Bud32